MNELFHLFETIPASRKLDVQLSLRPPRFQSVWRFQQMDIAKNLYTIFRGILLAAIYVARRCVSILNRHIVRFSCFLRFNSTQQKIVWIIIGHGRWKNYSLSIKCSNCSLNGNVISRNKIGSLVLNRLICLVRLYWSYWSEMIGIEILDGVIIAFLL